MVCSLLLRAAGWVYGSRFLVVVLGGADLSE